LKSKDVPDAVRNKLTKDFHTADLANRMNVTFKTAEKYAGKVIGEP
jgi:hypothetical protein